MEEEGYVQNHDGPKSGNMMGMWLMTFLLPKTDETKRVFKGVSQFSTNINYSLL